MKLHRKTRIAAITTALVVAASLAFAVVTGYAPITGGVQSNVFNPAWNDSAGASTVSTDMDCSAVVSGGTMTFNVTSAYAGGKCDATGGVVVSAASEQGTITGIELPGLPAGWEAEITQGCGGIVPSAASGQLFVTFQVRMTEAAVAGSAGTFASPAGVTLSPSALVGTVTTCPVFVGG
jgi:hypothetical protein